MKRLFASLICLLMLGSCAQKDHYVIQGSFSTPTDEEWIYLVKAFDQHPILDSTKIVDRQFTFRGTVGTPELYALHFSRTSKNEGVTPIILEPDTLEIILDPQNLDMLPKVEGGKFNEESISLQQYVNEYYEKERRKLLEKKALANEEQTTQIDWQIKTIEQDMFDYKLHYIKNHLSSPVSVVQLSSFFFGVPLEELEAILTGFSPELKKTVAYQDMASYLENEKELAGTTPALEIHEENNDLNKAAIFEGKSVIQTLEEQNPGKVLYLDIWATWCGPCIKEFPNSKALQENLSDQDIAFVYLCIRSEEDQWSDMIRKYDLKGQHYLLNKESIDRLEVEIGQFTGVPRYVVVDRHGKIIHAHAPSPSSPDIKNTLIQLAGG